MKAAYRLAHIFGWEELIYNHITVRLENEEGGDSNKKVERFLINPYTYGYNEVTASSLVTIDINGKSIELILDLLTTKKKKTGNVLNKGSKGGKINPAGFVIHSAIHAAR